MATTTRGHHPDRLDVYRVSYVIWSREDGEGGQRRRELREDRFAGAEPREAAAHAARWAGKTCRADDGWHFDGTEITAIRRVFTMQRCGQCGKFRGPEDSGVLCLCKGLRCKRCGRRNIWRPISTCYDEEKGGFWHVPHFAAWSWCDACIKARKEARRIFGRRRPWRNDRVLHGPATSIASAEELCQLCTEPLTEALLFLAVWAPGTYRMEREECDRTYLILSFRVSETTSAYVQFLSDPLHRTVLWEVSSLDYQPGLADRLTPDRQAGLLARGFETGASPSNYRREVVIDDDASACQTAREALDILFEVLGYRGEEALTLHVEAERGAGEGHAPGGFAGTLAVLLRQEEYGLRVVRGSHAGDEWRMDVRVIDDILLSVVSAPDARSFKVFTIGDHGTDALSTDVVVGREATEKKLFNAIRRLAREAIDPHYAAGTREGPS